MGATVGLVLLGLFLALGRGLGLVPTGPVLDAELLRRAGPGFVVWAALSWIAAILVGAFVTAVCGRSTHRRDGLLHGVATWGVACLTAGVLSCAWFMAAVPLGLASTDVAGVVASKGAAWAFFLADLLALAAALAGGLLGTRSETRLPRMEARREERAAAAPPRPAPQPT